MKALTILQPYASLIASGEKWIENRTWGANYRGPIAIHAGKGDRYLTAEQLRHYPTGCVVAIANLVDCLPLSVIQRNAHLNVSAPGISRTWKEIAEHPHTEGLICWVLENVRELQIRLLWKGEQGLWELPDDAIASFLKSENIRSARK